MKAGEVAKLESGSLKSLDYIEVGPSPDEMEWYEKMATVPVLSRHFKETCYDKGTWPLIEEGRQKDFWGAGDRVKGAKVYSFSATEHLGTSCHWCRQKTIDRKATCSNPDCAFIQTWCGACLYNRHREDILEILQDDGWLCPGCTGEGNCSGKGSFDKLKKGSGPCGMPRRGLAVTGQIDKVCHELNIAPNQYLHRTRKINFQDPQFVAPYIHQRAEAANMDVIEWLKLYHQKRHTVAGRMGLDP